MSTLGLMVDRAISPKTIPVLVDLGSVNDKPARDCADRLMAAGVAKSNFSIDPNEQPEICITGVGHHQWLRIDHHLPDMRGPFSGSFFEPKSP